MFALDPHRFEELLSRLQALCLDRKVTLATAESCTGGMISGLLTCLSGSSAIYLGGLVTYSNESKIRLLGVTESQLRQHGAVSEVVASSMAQGARQRLGSTWALAVTGIAGPSGGSAEKPVGTVYCAWSTEAKTVVRGLQLQGDRSAVRAQTCWEALDGLFRQLHD